MGQNGQEEPVWKLLECPDRVSKNSQERWGGGQGTQEVHGGDVSGKGRGATMIPEKSL